MTKDTDRRINMDLDRELLHKAKVQATIEGKTFREWITEAIREKLDRKQEG